MTTQDLIDQLLLVEDKTSLVVEYYDGWYNEYNSLATINLFTSDDCTNLYDNPEEATRMSDEDEVIISKQCILIDTSGGLKTFISDPQKYFYTK